MVVQDQDPAHLAERVGGGGGPSRWSWSARRLRRRAGSGATSLPTDSHPDALVEQVLAQPQQRGEGFGNVERVRPRRSWTRSAASTTSVVVTVTMRVRGWA